MKYIFNYFTLLLFASLVIVSCKRKTDNNGTGSGNLDQGVYLTGTATVFSSVGTAALFGKAPLDKDYGKPTGAGVDHNDTAIVLEKYAWLKASGTFTITISDANKVSTVYGKGDLKVTRTKSKTYDLTKDAAGFTVPADGLYSIVVCTENKQVTIAPATWGMNIGIPDQVMTVTPYNATTNDVVFSTTLDIAKAASWKFRYGGSWAENGDRIAFTNTPGDSVVVHNDLGSSDKTISNTIYGTTLLSIGGNDISVASTASYQVFFKYDVAKSTFSAYAVNKGVTSKPAAPDYLYITGTNFGTGKTYTQPLIMQPSMSGNVFWAIVWLDGTGTIQLSPKNDGSTPFGGTGTVTNGAGSGEKIYGRGTAAITEPTTPGYYMVTYKFMDAATHDSISIKPAEVYLVGPAAAVNTYDPNPANLFTLSGKTLVSPTFLANTELRICVYQSWIDAWWKSEFILLDPNIVYRGTAGDQARVKATVASVVTLNFITNTGTITP